ncbi:S-layer homology domain-containing protein [Paenibacillus elgii]|uniref:S-layer homology domain-containing protein n=1 Tax=Paenibacillus elgii TaxID=189691 RepID=UPI0013D6669D|nr:S-layer homology domain-containing protein [Paenibacillus elgii]
MISPKWKRTLSLIPLSICILGQGLPNAIVYGAPADAGGQASPSAGKWMTGEYHAHTYQSNDAQESLEHVLDSAFDQHGFDWLALADHLRMSNRDDNGNDIPGGPVPFSKGLTQVQAPKIKQLQESGKYKDKIIFSGFEWDMPKYEHVGVGIVTDNPGSPEALKAVSQFEYLFTDRDESLFDPTDVAAWKAQDKRAYTTRDDALTALRWLREKYPETSYAILNHPSRKGVYTIADIRDFNSAAPNIVFGFEGMIGGQMEPDRGGFNLTTPANRSYGGTDYMVAKLGGVWDSLLGEGRRFWNFSNSDFHFKISSNRLYSSGYWPGEYSKNYTWVNGSDMKAVVAGMRSGKSFSVYGDLINALDFAIAGDGRKEEMGGELQVNEGDNLQLTIRFKTPKQNNNGDPVQVDHVDLISGDVTGLAQPGTPEYNKDTNDSTKVLKRFTSADWTTDAEGYHVISYNLGTASKNQYFRLRGTNLGLNVEGETSNGEPLIDPKTDIADNETRFAEIEKRNYRDLWFYSNPIFVNVAPYSDQQAVDDTKQSLSLGDLSQVAANLQLPTTGKHGATISWTSSDPQRMTDDGKIVSRPLQDTVLTLTATIKRGNAVASQAFAVNLKGTSLELHGTWKTADGQPYSSGAWTNQSVTGSVYASVYGSVYGAGSAVGLELSTDNGQNYKSYQSNSNIEISQEGVHSRLFRATDVFGNKALLPLTVNIDLTPPVITLKGDPTVNLTVGAAYVEQGASAADNFRVDGDVVITGAVDTHTAGTYTVHYNARDLAGNRATEVRRTVVVAKAADSSDSSGDSGSSGSGGGSSSSSGNSGSPTTQPASGDKPNRPVSLELAVNAKQATKGSIKDAVTVEVPAGALPSNGTIRASILSTKETPSAGNLRAVSPAIEFTSTTGHTFNQPIALTFHYNASLLLPGHQAAVYYYHEQQKRWIYIGGTNRADGTVTVNVNHFTKFAVFDYQPAAFLDLAGHWAAPYTDRLVGMNVIQGFEDRMFRPETLVTRGQFAKMMAEALGLQASADASGFADDPQIPDWAKPGVTAAVKAGLIHGYEENGRTWFKADQTITRAEMSVMIANALNSGGGFNSGNETKAFRDAASIPAWAEAAVNASVSAGIVSGYEDQTFRAGQTATRAEAATMIYKLLEALKL